MFYERASTIVRKGRSILEEEKQTGLLKVIKYITANFFKYSKIVVYETDLRKQLDVRVPAPEIENLELEVISNEDQLNTLVEAGYDFSFYPGLKVDKSRLKTGASLIAIFIKRKLVYRSWLALTRESVFKMGPFLKAMDYDNQAVGAAAETDPQYRGRRIFQYAAAYCNSYARKMGKSKKLTYVEINNRASRKVQEKIGMGVTCTGHRIRLFYLWDIFRIHSLNGNTEASQLHPESVLKEHYSQLVSFFKRE